MAHGALSPQTPVAGSGVDRHLWSTQAVDMQSPGKPTQLRAPCGLACYAASELDHL